MSESWRLAIAVAAVTGSTFFVVLRFSADILTVLPDAGGWGFELLICAVLASVVAGTTFLIRKLRLISKVEILDTTTTYKRMKEDAEKADEILLTSIQANPLGGIASEAKSDYFQYIDKIMADDSKTLQRTIAVDGPDKSQEVLRSLDISKTSRLVKIGMFPYRINAFNLQIFKGRSVYVIDPIFEGENSSRNSRHIRLVGKRVEREMLDRYHSITSDCLLLKDGLSVDSRVRGQVTRISEQVEHGIGAFGPPFLAYQIDNMEAPRGSKSLVRLSDHDLIELDWDSLTRNIKSEEALISYEKETLIRRFKEGNAAVVLNGHEILSYVSLKPVMSPSLCDRIFGVQDVPLAPRRNVFEMATGWTDIRYRCTGLSTFLRRKLFSAATKANPNTLILSYSKGVGAGPVLSRMGWKRLSWNKVPFLSSLIGWPSEDEFYKLKVGPIVLNGEEFWDGAHDSLVAGQEDQLAQYLTLWVSDFSEAVAQSYRTDRQLENSVRVFRSSPFASPRDASSSGVSDIDWWRLRLKSAFRERLYLLGEEKGGVFSTNRDAKRT